MASFTIFNPANLPKEEIESDKDTETETKSFEEYGFDHVKALSKRFGRANISENEILTEYENVSCHVLLRCGLQSPATTHR